MKGFFNFNLIFAMIAGAAILFLAIYGAVRFGEIFNVQRQTYSAKELAILTDPLQSGFAESKYGVITFSEKTKIRNFCKSHGFGANEISTGVEKKDGWSFGVPISVHNKYIFSSEVESKDFYVFSTGFEFPYKVADLIFITGEHFCFVNPPEEIEEEIEGLRIENININNCSAEDVRVCFDSGNCEINVYGIDDFNEGYVEKNGKRNYFVGGLIYGAIFSDKAIYDCNVERLLYRAGKIAEVFGKKADLMNLRGVDTNLKASLLSWKGMLAGKGSEELISLNQAAKELENENEIERRGGGGIW